MIGAAVAENPYVMMSAGWVQDKNGDWVDKYEDVNKILYNLSISKLS